jgi:plastocyanin
MRTTVVGLKARAIVAGLAIFVGFSSTASGVVGVDVRGTAKVGDRTEPNAVIWLDAPNAPRSRSNARIVVDQRNLTFYPHVLAVRTGTTVEFPNSDRVFHNVFSFRDGKRFDLGMYPVGTMRPVTFEQSGLSRLFCNIHPNMAAYVMALDTPYFAVADKLGAFTIPAVPAGSYPVGAWRPGGTILSGTFKVDEGQPLEIRWP